MRPAAQAAHEQLRVVPLPWPSTALKKGAKCQALGCIAELLQPNPPSEAA